MQLNAFYERKRQGVLNSKITYPLHEKPKPSDPAARKEDYFYKQNEPSKCALRP